MLKGSISTQFNYCINNKDLLFCIHPVMLLLYMNHCNEMYSESSLPPYILNGKNLKHTFQNIFPHGLFQGYLKTSAQVLVSICSHTSVAK